MNKIVLWICFMVLVTLMFFCNTILYGQDYEHYSVVSHNSLFRPLGWKPPKETPRIKLIGTWINEKGDERIAYVRNFANGKITRLGINSNIVGTVVLHIKHNTLEMKNGEVYELSKVSFLKSSGRNNNSKRRSTEVVQRESSSQERERRTRRNRSNSVQKDTQSIRQRWRNASSEERIRMIENFTKRRDSFEK